MDIEKLIEQLNDWNEKYISNLCGDRTIKCEEYCIKDDCLIVKAATALSTLQAENEKLRAELGREQRLYESEKEDFIDCVCSGVPNLSPYCMNRHPDCVDERGWCRTEKCRGFSRDRDRKED